MKRMRRFYCLLAAVVLLGLTVSCAAKKTLAGTWEATVDLSVLGVGQEAPQTAAAVLRFVFQEDGNGAMETEFDGEHPAVSRAFQYSTQEDQLILDYTDGGSPSQYTFALEGDTLTLNGRVDVELTRVSG